MSVRRSSAKKRRRVTNTTSNTRRISQPKPLSEEDEIISQLVSRGFIEPVKHFLENNEYLEFKLDDGDLIMMDVENDLMPELNKETSFIGRGEGFSVNYRQMAVMDGNDYDYLLEHGILNKPQFGNPVMTNGDEVSVTHVNIIDPDRYEPEYVVLEKIE